MDVKIELRELLGAAKQDYWRDRLVAEIGFVEQLTAVSTEGTAAVAAAAGEASERIRREGGVSRECVLEFETKLAGIGPACKAYELVCVGHAHIDMNWMWGFHETVAITIDTFRTVLALLERYPQFHFSQSQAAVYQIVERFAPQLVAPIRSQIASGRWEVTASQWVESDMNLPSGESLARQMLYARRYLIDRFAAPEESFSLVFLPDTFGHNANTPEILAAAGVRYLYHCRGAVGPHLSRWEAPSGSSITVYREPRWYNTDISGGVADFLPRFAQESGVMQALCLYGVGDHGGGPTARDIERLADMHDWPLFPTITFGTLRGYFERIAAAGVVPQPFRGERNMIFTGCYSSQSRIKMANRTAEKLLYEAELDVALARLFGGTQNGDDRVALNLREAWTRALFSNFHDILPGSGVQLTREYALGSFQETAAAALAAQSEALRRLSLPQTATAREPLPGNRSEGAGVGYGAERFRLPATERGAGKRRFYHLYNSLQWEREELTEITVWDWPGDGRLIECVDRSGRRIDHQLVASGTDEYWGHNYLRLRLRLTAPAFGYAVAEVREAGDSPPREVFFPWGVERWLVEPPPVAVLENSRIRAAFDPVTMRLCSLYDKSTEVELVAARTAGPAGDGSLHAGGAAGRESGGLFRVVEEEADRMTSWLVGRYQGVRPIERVVRIADTVLDPSLPQQWIEYELAFPNGDAEPGSRMTVRVSLDRDSSRIRYEVDCHWLEAGELRRRVPQLQFFLALSRPARALRCDIPFGTIDREAAALDVPANSFAAAIPESGSDPVVQITSDSRQAFRFDSGALSLTLLRSSVDPDPYPELGRHQFSFSIAVLSPAAAYTPSVSLREALETRHPLRAFSAATGAADAGSPFLVVESANCIVSAVKSPEPDGWSTESAPGPGEGARRRIIIRLYEANGAAGDVEIRLRPGAVIDSARFLDLHERPIEGESPAIERGVARISVPPHRLVTLELGITTE